MKKKPEPPTTAMKPIKVGQKIFREWCAEFGAVVDVEMAANLVKRIEAVIIAERETARCLIKTIHKICWSRSSHTRPA